MRRFVAVTTEVAWLLCGLTLVAIGATYPLIRHMTTNLPGDLGDPVLVSWILAWDAHAFRHGITRIFDAPSFFPYLHTLVFSEHMFGVAIFTAPLQWLTAKPVLVYNVAFIAAFVQAGAGMYLLARTLTGRRDAAWLAALAYAFTPQRVAQFAHLPWLMTGWLPLSLWALHRYFSTGALAFLLASAAAYVLQSLTGSYFTYFALVPLAVVAIAETWRTRPPLRRTVLHLAMAGFLCVLTLAPVVSAYYGARKDHDFRRSPSEISAYSADLGDYFHAHNHVRLWRDAPWGSGEHELFPGAIVLILAGVALFAARRAPVPYLRIYAAIAAITLVLSLGPTPAAWGHVVPFPGPYQILLDYMPGLDGLRAPARSGMMVGLALCVLAAYGSGRVVDRVAPRRRWLVVAALAIGLIAEGWSAPILTTRFDPLQNADDRHAYTFLRQSGPEGAVLELPLSHVGDEREIRYQYLTLVHGHRTVNGSSGYTPALTQWLYSEDQSPLLDINHPDVAVEFSRALGVRYVVVHRGAFEQPAMEAALLRELDGDRPQVIDTHAFGQTVVYTLADAPPPVHESVTRRVPASAIRARASNASSRLPLLFDGNRDTRWLTGGRQTGREWIELLFDTPRRVAAVRMQTAERSFGDYPRELAIDVLDGTDSRTVFQGPVLAEFGRGVAVNLKYPTIEIPLPDNRATGLRLRQLGATSVLYWSIHELEILER
jgi:hypothetical protein